MTTFIFWQNSLSIHQSAFLRNLADSNSVILVVEKQIDSHRLGHGWNIPDFGNVQVFVEPNNSQIDLFLDTPNAIHIFSGIQSFYMPREVFRIAVKKRLMIGVIAEPYNWLGFKGKLRYLKYLKLRMRYAKHIHLILVTGFRGRWCFEVTGFRKEIIYDWAYFTETPIVSIRQNDLNCFSLLFIGSIDKRKNILHLVSVCKKLKIIDHFQIIGVGPLENELQTVLENTQCKYWGQMPNKDIHVKLESTDLLILPSVFDGWGAVVNEALMCGVPVVVSENCGSSALVNGDRGRVFSLKGNHLEEVLMDFVKQLPYGMEKRQEIRNWALANISGEMAARYFTRIIEHVTGKSVDRPVAPWIKNDSKLKI